MDEETKQYIKEVRLIDDSFFEIFFKKDPKFIEIVIREIFKQLGRPLVRVKTVSTQERLNTVAKRDVCLDALAVDEEGNWINIEVQRSVTKSIVKRARYYSSLLDANMLKSGEETDQLHETYVIFITEKDFCDLGLPAYQVDRYIKENGKLFGDENHIIFVNGQYRENDPIGNLMNDFFSRGADEMKNPELAERVRFFKETEEGQRELSGIEARIEAKGEAKKQREIAAKMLKMAEFTLEQIAQATGLTASQVNRLKAELQ